MIYRIYTDDTWVSYEQAIAGEYTYEQMRELYEDTVDKDVYQCFAAWLWDMERSATFYRHGRRPA